MRPSIPDASAQATRPRRGVSIEPQGSASGVRPAAPRKRVAEGLRAPTLRGGGARGVGSSSARFPNGFSAWQRRSLQSTLPRSHDERCPSGSGWDKALSPGRPIGWPRAEAPAAKAAALLARETSTGGCPRGRMGSRPRPAKVLGRPQGLLGAGAAAPPVSGAGTRSSNEAREDGAPPQTPAPRSEIRSTGSARATPESGASDARKRTLATLVAPETGIRRSCGRARGLCWLQKSTSGARSKAERPWV